jgi:CheY-like chemotaxis protein
MSIAGTPACRYTLTDGTGELDLLFLGRVEIAGIRSGRRCRAVGTVARRDDRLVLWNPRYWLEPAGADSESPDVPVTAISAREAVATRSALAAGASDYLTKPFAMDTLLTKIH